MHYKRSSHLTRSGAEHSATLHWLKEGAWLTSSSVSVHGNLIVDQSAYEQKGVLAAWISISPRFWRSAAVPASHIGIDFETKAATILDRSWNRWKSASIFEEGTGAGW